MTTSDRQYMAFLATCFSLMLSGGALAEVEPVPEYQATADRPSIPQGPFSLDGLEWTCRGARCTSAQASAMPPLAVCLMISEVIGTVKEFHTRGRALPTADIARCNGLPPPTEDALAQNVEQQEHPESTMTDPSTPDHQQLSSAESPAANDGTPLETIPATKAPDIKSSTAVSALQVKQKTEPGVFQPLRIRTGMIQMTGVKRRDGS